MLCSLDCCANSITELAMYFNFHSVCLNVLLSDREIHKVTNFCRRFQVFEDVHLDSKPTLKKVLDYLNIVFAVVFTLEFLLKTLGLGFLTYFKNAWNCLDVVIVVVSTKLFKK